jgi:hypothetical protein
MNLVGKFTEEVRKEAQKKDDEEDEGRNSETPPDRSKVRGVEISWKVHSVQIPLHSCLFTKVPDFILLVI